MPYGEKIIAVASVWYITTTQRDDLIQNPIALFQFFEFKNECLSKMK